MTAILIKPIEKLTYAECQPLIQAALDEGDDFIQRLWEEYESGENRFDEHGAILLGAYADNQLIGTGGVNRDPYLSDPTIGRVRHLFVLPVYRKQGAGSQLMRALIDHARLNFNVLTLRAITPYAHNFYLSLGFTDEHRFDRATHWLNL